MAGAEEEGGSPREDLPPPGATASVQPPRSSPGRGAGSLSPASQVLPGQGAAVLCSPRGTESARQGPPCAGQPQAQPHPQARDQPHLQEDVHRSQRAAGQVCPAVRALLPRPSRLLVFQPTCLADGQAGLSHIQAVMSLGHHVQAHRLEWRRGCCGDSGKPLAFQVGELRPRKGTGLTQGHTEGTTMPLLPKSSLCAIKWI